MANYLAPIINDQQENANGAPLSGGTIEVYLAGSSTPVTTYSDRAGLVPNTWPIVLNTLGVNSQGAVWVTGGASYKFIIKDSVGVVQRTVDNVSGINDSAVTADQWVVYQGAPTYVNGTTFTVAGDQTGIFQVGRRLKTQNTSGPVYSSIREVVYLSPNTTITVLNDGVALDSGLSLVSYGLLSSVDVSIPYLPRYRLRSNLTLFVSTTGNDSNDGLSLTKSLLTIQRAYNVLQNNYDLAGFTATIQVADGTYTAGLVANGPVVGQQTNSSVMVTGNLVTPANVFINVTNAPGFYAGNGAAITISGFGIAATGATGVQGFGIVANALGQISFGTVAFAACGQAHLGAQSGGQLLCTANYSASGSSPAHITLSSSGIVTILSRTVTFTGSPNFSAATVFAASNSFANLVSNAYVGVVTGTRYNVNTNAVISTNGGGAGALPGSIAGVAATGGQYV